MTALLVLTTLAAAAAFVAAAPLAGSGADSPSQVHISQNTAAGCCGMTITWATTAERYGEVRYGPSPDSLVMLQKAEDGESYTFVSKYTGSYTSPLLHHAKLQDLSPSTKYYYKCGSDDGGFSEVFSFTTPPTPGPEVPFTFALIGDLGQTGNSSETMKHVMEDDTMGMTLLVGDLSYADSAWDPKEFGRNNTQRRWDSWSELVEPLFANQALMALPGNHEVEQDGAAPATQTQFLAYSKRFTAPDGGDGALYYSFDVASAHVIHLNS